MRVCAVSFAGVLVLSACAIATRAAPLDRPIAELWQQPADLERRNLFFGPGGKALAPEANARYTMTDVDKEGFSPGYDVRDAQGRSWSVKLGPEAQTEVVVSRLLWAIGYHQPATYYVPRWTLVEDGRPSAQGEARFRLEPDNRETVREWAWRDNPFLATQPFQGLVVFMVMVNNWDLKTSQNPVYRVQAEESGEAELRYVVKDLGASLGKTNWILPGTRNDVEDFEREGFIKDIEGNRVVFDYKGAWLEPQVVANIAPADVRWISDLLARLTPRQWRDAFRAGGYPDDVAERYITRLREKVAEGQAVGRTPS